MTRAHWLIVMSIALAIVIAINRAFDEPQPVASAQVAVLPIEPIADAHTDALFIEENRATERGAAAELDAVAKWNAVAGSDNEQARRAAIDGLAQAPQNKSLPILRKLVASGEDGDRQAALNALHTLALQQGDATGEIQELLRLTSYDGDDAIAGDAQLALEDIERGSDKMLLINP